MTKNARSAPPLTGGVMSDKPLSFPRAGLDVLSDDARQLHRHASSGSGQYLNRDIFDPKSRHRFVSKEDAEAFKPTKRMKAAIAELEAIGLARYEPEFRALYTTRVHKLYTYARGRGSQIIKVSLFGEDEYDSRLLTVLIGGDLESRDQRNGVGSGMLAIRARHETATDVEHDASSSALIEVRNISQPEFTGYGRMRFSGVLTKAHLYKIGVDPLQADDGETRPGRTCDHCDDPHPFAPFLPPHIEQLDGPRLVLVETLPFQGYQVEDLFTQAAGDSARTIESETA